MLFKYTYNHHPPLYPELQLNIPHNVLPFHPAVAIAQMVPHLNIIISLIGALCSTALALFIPAIIELVLAYGAAERDAAIAQPATPPVNRWMLAKNAFVILLAFVGLVTGTVESVNLLVVAIGT